MKRSPKPYPLVITHLVEAFIATAKLNGVRGRIAVYETDVGGERHYAIVVRVPAGETVMTRAVKR